MTDAVTNILITAKDQTAQAFASVNSGLTGLSSQALKATAALGAIGAGAVTDAVRKLVAGRAVSASVRTMPFTNDLPDETVNVLLPEPIDSVVTLVSVVALRLNAVATVFICGIAVFNCAQARSACVAKLTGSVESGLAVIGSIGSAISLQRYHSVRM